jgi:hypothetical protein
MLIGRSRPAAAGVRGWIPSETGRAARAIAAPSPKRKGDRDAPPQRIESHRSTSGTRARIAISTLPATASLLC